MLTTRTDKILWGILAAWALASAILSVWGWVLYESARGGALDFETWLDIGARTISFFFAEAPGITIPSGNIPIKLARVLAPLATAGAVLRVGIEFFAGRLRARRIRRLHGHTVVCGITRNALSFAVSEKARGLEVVIVGDWPDEGINMVARLHEIDVLAGDPLDPAVLSAAAVAQANRLIAAMVDDGDNLEVAMRARRLVDKDRRGDDPLRVNIAVGNRQLWRQITRSDSILRNSTTFEILPFNLGVWAARQFTWDEPLWNYSVLRGQHRIHAVFIGCNDYAEAMIGHLPPSCAFPGLERPIFTLLVEEVEAARGRIAQAYPCLDEVADVSFHGFAPGAARLDTALMSEVAEAGDVTAIFVCLENETDALGAAIYVQDVARRTGFWRAPVYVRLSKCDGVGDLLVESTGARRFDEVIQPFGVEERLCTLESLEGRLERIAEAIHLAYRDSRQASIGRPQPGRSVTTLSEWLKLPETYRASNRRAIDHIKAKLSSAGCFVPKGTDLKVPGSFRLNVSEDALEAMAELEHRSWLAGRYLDGWRFSERRDDDRRLHPDMVDYVKLDERTRDFDRDQVRLIDHSLLVRVENRSKDLIRIDQWVGLIGKNRIDEEEGAWLRDRIATDVFPKLVAKAPDVHWTLVTPLAPGADYVMTLAAVDYLRTHDISHRLLVVEAVPEARLISDYRPAFDGGASWDGHQRAESATWDVGAKGPESVAEAIAAARQQLIASDSTEWVIDLTDPLADYYDGDMRKKGYRRAGDYVLQHAAILIAAHRPSKEPQVSPMGGTGETLDRRAEYVRDHRPQGFSNLILDLEAREILEERL